jgi:hypothetical protein
MKINDVFYLKNFKGVRNIGYHYDSSLKEGINGENLGFDRYLQFGAKAYMIESKLLSSFNVDPFLHMHVALAPNRNEPKVGENFI